MNPRNLPVPAQNRRAFSLIEIMIAMAIIAFAFMPIIGAMSTSMRGTMKDEKVVQAMNMAQTSLNAALQFPFDALPAYSRSLGGPANGPWSFGGTAQPNFSYATSSLALRLGQIGDFTVDLRIFDEQVTFVVPQYSAASRSVDIASNPANWSWTNYTSPTMQGVYHKYVLTVSWLDQNGTKTYRLASFKARLVQ